MVRLSVSRTPAPARPLRGPVRSRRPARLVAACLALVVATATGPARAQSPGRTADEDLVTLNFHEADLDVVLDAVGRTLGLTYVVAPEVRRKVTAQGRVARRDLLDVLLAILDVHGLAAVRSGEVYKIVRRTAATVQGLPVVVGPEPDPTRRPGELVTQVVPLRHGSATTVAQVLGPLVSPEGSLAVHRDTNVLVITDSVERLRRHLRIAQSLDLPRAEAQIQAFSLRSADATTLAGLLSQLLAAAGPAAPVESAPARPGEPGGGPVAPPAAAPPPEAFPRRAPVILADPRTNTLLAAGPPEVLGRIQELVSRLDQETPPPRGLYLYRVEHLRAKELAATLNQLFRRRPGEAEPGRGLPRPGPGEPAPGPAPPPASGPREGEPDALADVEARVIPDEATNTLLVAAAPATWAVLEPVLRRLDRMPRRILIDVLVTEITLDEGTALGVEWSLRSQRGIQIGGERLSLETTLDVGVPGIQPLPPGVFFVLRSSDILALLQAFARANRLNVLSNPHVLTSENKRAQIHVGRSVPVLTTQQQPATGIAPQAQPTAVITTTVDYRDTGILLTVAPRVSEDRFIALDVRQEVSDAVPNVVSATPSPVFTKRVAETSVVVGEHETLVLGGLMEEQRVRQREGIPFLSRLPILGALFGTTSEATRKTELLILVTPRLVPDAGAGQSLLEELRRRAPELRRDRERPPPGRAPTDGAPAPPAPSER